MTREDAKILLPVIQAYAEGRTVQCFGDKGWTDTECPSFDNSPPSYRIKPTPVKRAWLPNEIPLGVLFKHKESGTVYTPLAVTPHCGVTFLSDGVNCTPLELRDFYLWSEDHGHTWLACETTDETTVCNQP